MKMTDHRETVGLWAVVPRAHGEEDLVLTRVVADTVTVLHHRSETQEQMVVGDWDLQ